MSKFIDDHKETFGVEPMCAVLPIAPATYYAAKTRPPSMRALADQELEAEIKLSTTRTTASTACARSGSSSTAKDVRWPDAPSLVSCANWARRRRPGRAWKTTKPDTSSSRPADLVDRRFTV